MHAIKWCRPRLITIRFPLQLEHDYDFAENHPCFIICRKCEESVFRETDVMHFMNTEQSLCFTCGKKKRLECEVAVDGFGFRIPEQCKECKVSLSVSVWPVLQIPCRFFMYYWTRAIPSHVGSDFALKSLMQTCITRDVWLMIQDYCFPSNNAVALLYLDKKESSRTLLRGGVFPGARRAVIYVRGQDQGQDYHRYYRYEHVGCKTRKQIQAYTIYCD